MKKLLIILDLSNKSLEFYKNIIIDFSKELGKIDLIDVSQILKKKSIYSDFINNNNFNLIQPKNYTELIKIFKTKDIVLMYTIQNGFSYFLINFYLSKYKVCKFFVSNLGYNPENFNYYNRNFFNKINIFLKLRLKYYFFRILILFGIFPKIDFFFESSNFIYKSIKNGFSYKLNKLIPFINISYYKKIIKINSRYFDSIFYSKHKISDEFIVFLDGMPFDHKDRILRDGVAAEDVRKKYYNDLYKILKDLEIKFNKKIIICLHPKNNISIVRKDFKDFMCVKFETEKYVSQGFIIIYHEGSSILQGFVQKKKIINIHGKILGNYINKRCDMYANPLKLFRIDLNNIKLENKEQLLIKMNEAINQYEIFNYENLINNSNKSGISEIIEYLNIKN
tara:strand:+ start:15866 stop:17047 length:1182 start_codon:yes stop_codon:yes gene_type:complete